MKNFIQITIVIFVTLCLAEITCRIYDFFYPSVIFSNNGYDQYKKPVGLDKKLFHLNSKGYRDIEHSQRKEHGIFRIVGIGDSFTYGVVPHENNFLTLLEWMLNRKGRKYEVVNMGVPAIGVDSFYKILIRDGLPEDPDMVIVCVFIEDINRKTELNKKRPFSYLQMFIKYIFKVYPHLSRSSKDTSYNGYVYNDSAPTFTLSKFLNIELDRSFIYQKNNRPLQSEFQKNLAYVSPYFKSMKEQCDKHHVKFLVVIIPDELQVNADLQKQVIRESKTLKLTDFDFKLPNRLLKEKLNKLNIDNIDLLEGFLLHSKNTRYYKPQDTHWNLAGNALGAELICQKLKPNEGICNGPVVPDDFNWHQYIANYPDLQQVGINTKEKAEEHWVRFGYAEKRSYKAVKVPADFDWKQYIANYPDLQKAGIDTKEKAEKHWIDYGYFENRNYKAN